MTTLVYDKTTEHLGKYLVDDLMHQNANELIRASGKLKQVPRTGWLKKAGMKECESVADHSYRMALIGTHLSLELGLDSAKVARMCLIHDLAESEIGDKMPEEKVSERTHRKLEDFIVRRVLSSLPSNSKKIFLSDWRELLGRKSREARLTREVDKLEMSLQARDYIKQGYSKRKLRQFDASKALSRRTCHIVEEYRP